MTTENAELARRLESLERTVRGHPDEGHGGLMAEARTTRRLLIVVLVLTLVSAVESAPALLAGILAAL